MNKRLYAILALYAEDMRKMEERQEEFLSVDARSWDFEDEDIEKRNYQVVNGIAIYNIRGKLMNESNFFTRVFGIPSYEGIMNDFAIMAQDEEIDEVLVSMSTPGGPVAGISEILDAWSKLDAIKPITTHTSGTLASAGMWLASNSSGGIYASDVAEVGSIGVITQHVSYQEQLKKEGIKVTQIKSAPLKAVGAPSKDLSADEEAHLQKKVNDTASIFRHQIYRKRPRVTEEAFSGETFIASEALRVGLIDGVKNFSDVFSTMASAAGTANKPLHTGGYDMKKKVTAAMYDAAVEAGTDPNTLEVVSQADYDALTASEGSSGDVIKVTQEMFDAKVAEGVAPEAMEVVSQEEFDALGSSTEDDQIVADLEAKITALTDQLQASTAEVTRLEAELTSVSHASSVDPLRVIAIERLSTMRVALGLQKLDMSDFTNNTLATEYVAIDKAFKKAYKTGGHTSIKVKETPEAPVKQSVEVARIDSVF